MNEHVKILRVIAQLLEDYPSMNRPIIIGALENVIDELGGSTRASRAYCWGTTESGQVHTSRIERP